MCIAWTLYISKWIKWKYKIVCVWREKHWETLSAPKDAENAHSHGSLTINIFSKWVKHEWRELFFEQSFQESASENKHCHSGIKSKYIFKYLNKQENLIVVVDFSGKAVTSLSGLNFEVSILQT